MANRNGRFGGGMGGSRGGPNRNFAPSSNINPWQGGVAPSNPNSNINTQLALALTNLIQQSQHPGRDGPPSLLSMNTSPAFYQDNFNNQDRFGNRRQDFRRSEPFNKNNRGGIWRSDSHIRPNRGSNFSSKNRSNNKQHSPSRDKSKNKKSHDKDKTSTPKAEKTTDSADDRNEDASDKKRDWKEEKKPEDATEGEENEEAKEGDAKRPPKATKFDGLPNSLLHCFVCNKSMWDGESFQNHVGGKAHKQMINSLEESFQITVNILRENMRLCEERKMIEMERMQRSRRFHHKMNREQESHCNMCDLKFMGKIVVHRQTEGHQRLKRFLHPKCKKCNLEFPSRMEWVDHQFIPDHLLKMKEYLISAKLDMGEFKLNVEVENNNDPLLEESIQYEDENPVTELSQDMTNLFNRIPVYKADRDVCKETLKPAEGFMCELCKIFMPSEEESQKHLRSPKHYHKFVGAAKTKFQKSANKKKRKADEVDGDAEGVEEEEVATEEADESTKMEEDGEAVEDEKSTNDMYDPFTTDTDVAMKDETAGEEEAAVAEEVDEETAKKAKDEEEEAKLLEEDQEEEEEEEEEEEVVKKPAAKLVEKKQAPATPRTRRTGVKNGAGPKSKKAKN